MYNDFGPLTKYKLNVDQEKWPCTKKFTSQFFYDMPKKSSFEEKKFKFDHYLGFMFCFRAFSLNFSMEKRRSLIMLLWLYMYLYMLVKHVVHIQALFLQGEWEIFKILSWVNKSMGHRDRNLWSQKRMYGFVDHLLLGFWTQNHFTKQPWVKYITFKFLCEKLGPYLKRYNIHFRITLLAQERVAISSHRLDSSNRLQSIGDLYIVHKRTLSKILREFCKVVRKHIKPIFVSIPSQLQFKVLTSRFK